MGSFPAAKQLQFSTQRPVDEGFAIPAKDFQIIAFKLSL
jgi:hypothetical protein